MTSRTFNNDFNVTSVFMWPGSSNNYAYVVTDLKTKDAAVVDPAEPKAAVAGIEDAKAKHGSVLKAIINTHHHWDHAGGNKDMLKTFGSLPIYGGKDCDSVTNQLRHKESFELGSLTFHAMHTPCHTQDSICWWVTSKNGNESVVFTGDTLFHGGCGKFFEGNPTQMNTALNDVLASLPDATVVYPGHEYTSTNWKFASSVFKGQVKEAENLKPTEKVTCGTRNIGQEKQYNPFMMVAHPIVQEATGESDPVKVMAKLRAMKNSM